MTTATSPRAAPGAKNLSFRCTGCGNCCKEPLLPLTDVDVRRISLSTGDPARDIVRWVDKAGIEMDDEPEAFVNLRQGKRVMVLAHSGGGCRYLGDDDRCTIYAARPLGCRLYPFDPTFKKDGSLRRLTIVRATECPNESDGDTTVAQLRAMDDAYQAAHAGWNEKIAEWNRAQTAKKRAGKAAGLASAFLSFVGLA